MHCVTTDELRVRLNEIFCEDVINIVYEYLFTVAIKPKRPDIEALTQMQEKRKQYPEGTPCVNHDDWVKFHKAFLYPVKVKISLIDNMMNEIQMIKLGLLII